jgi:hypothetical protein
MVQLLTTKYNEEEGSVLIVSNLLGFCISAIVSALICYLVGLFSNIRSTAHSLTRWTIWLFKVGSIWCPLSWLLTLGLCLLFLQKSNVGQWRHNVRRMIPGTLFLPLGLTYSFVVMGLVIFPLDSFLSPYITPGLAMFVSLIALFPFVVLGGAIVLPEGPAGKALRKFIRRLQRATESRRREE